MSQIKSAIRVIGQDTIIQVRSASVPGYLNVSLITKNETIPLGRFRAGLGGFEGNLSPQLSEIVESVAPRLIVPDKKEK